MWNKFIHVKRFIGGHAWCVVNDFNSVPTTSETRGVAMVSPGALMVFPRSSGIIFFCRGCPISLFYVVDLISFNQTMVLWLDWITLWCQLNGWALRWLWPLSRCVTVLFGAHTQFLPKFRRTIPPMQNFCPLQQRICLKSTWYIILKVEVVSYLFRIMKIFIIKKNIII